MTTEFQSVFITNAGYFPEHRVFEFTSQLFCSFFLLEVTRLLNVTDINFSL